MSIINKNIKDIFPNMMDIFFIMIDIFYSKSSNPNQNNPLILYNRLAACLSKNPDSDKENP